MAASNQFIVAVDVGVKNMALCIFDLTQGKVIHWHVGSLVPDGKRYLPHSNVQYVRDWLTTWKGYFDNALAVIVERQMRCNMRIIESLIHHEYYDKCYIINARSVKLHYGLSMRNYRQNKNKAIEWATDFIAKNPQVFDPTPTEVFRTSVKRDDYADSLLLAMYYLDTFSRQAE